MSDTPQNDPLLSAFLDGELRQDQRELVEKRIANNQSLLTLLQQWKDQGNAIRSFPKHQLRGDLSQSILDEINRRRLTGELAAKPAVALTETRFLKTTEGARFRNNWRTTLVAIASLAGMILIGFFLSRPDPTNQQPLVKNTDPKNSQTQPLAGSEGNETSSDVALDQVVDSESAIRSDPGAAGEKPKKSSIDSDASDALASRFNAETSDAPVALSESRQMMVENAPGRGGLGELDSSRQALKDNQSFENPDLKAAIDLSLKEDLSPAIAHLRPSDKLPTAPAKEQEAKSLEGDMAVQHTPNEDLSRQAVSIPQVYFVEFTSKEQPLAVVSEVFSRNQIELRLPEGLEASSAGSSNEALKTLAAKSSQGLEAIYVVATRSQLSQAMTELSDSANISGFEVTSSMLGKMLAPLPNENANQKDPAEPRMDVFIAQSQSGSGSLLFKDKLKKNENRETAEKNKATIGEPVPMRAMAQQLQPFERRQRQSPANVDVQRGIADAEKQSDPLDQLIQSPAMKINWNFSLATDSSTSSFSLTDEAEQKATSELEVDKGFAEQAAQEELVQFLLLIRTTRAE